MISKQTLSQFRAISMVAGAASGLHIFAGIFGPMGDFLSVTFSRIILNYDTVIKSIVSKIGNIIGISLAGYEAQIAFSTIILTPYLIRWRHVKFSGYFEDELRLLAISNFVAFTMISSAFNQWNFAPWAGWLTAAAISLVFVGTCANAIIRDDDYMRTGRAVIFVSFATIFGMSMLGFIHYSSGLEFSGPTIVQIMVTLVTSFIYLVGISFRIDGYYPFLTGGVFFIVFYIFDYILKGIAPWIDQYLTSIGA